MIDAELEVAHVSWPTPSFVRVELAGPELAELGVDGPLLDQRIKLVVPAPAGQRGTCMRTYTAREVRGRGPATRLVVDLVRHPGSGDLGPAAAWAERARVGDRIGVLAPRRGVPFGGIEFCPGSARRLLVVGDETAVPAVAGILRDLPRGARGAVFLEVPVAGDAQDLGGPRGVDVTWLSREGRPHGVLLREAVLRHLGAPAGAAGEPGTAGDPVADPDLWETPSYSSSGEPLPEPGALATDGLYAWIAGEAGVVTGLRRVLVRDLGMDRRQVAFMGYWRRGVAMRS